MAVYNIQQPDYWRYYIPYLASTGGTIASKWMDQVYERANNAKQQGYLSNFNKEVLSGLDGNLDKAQLLQKAMENRWYGRLNQASRDAVNNLIDAKAQSRYENMLAPALRPQIIGDAITGQQAPSQAQGSLPQTQGPVNTGYYGDNLANTLIAMKGLRFDPTNINTVLGITMPKAEYHDVDKGDMVETYNQPSYGTRTLVGSVKKQLSPDKAAEIANAIEIQKMQDVTSTAVAGISAAAQKYNADRIAQSNNYKENASALTFINGAIGNIAKVMNAKKGDILDNGDTVTEEMQKKASEEYDTLMFAQKKLLGRMGLLEQAKNPTSKPDLDTTTWSQEDLTCYNRILEEIKAGKLNMTEDEAKAYIISKRNKKKK